MTAVECLSTVTGEVELKWVPEFECKIIDSTTRTDWGHKASAPIKAEASRAPRGSIFSSIYSGQINVVLTK